MDRIPASGKKGASNDSDPGCQEPHTGAFGGLFILALAAAYAMFKANILRNGGPPANDWLPLPIFTAEFHDINRDYFDIVMIVAMGLVFMIVWEFRASKTSRAVTAAIALALVAVEWMTARGAKFFFTAPTHRFAGWDWTSFEVPPAVACCAFALHFAADSARKNDSLNPAPFYWALKTGFFRWLSGLVFFSIAMLLFCRHPFYVSPYYENWRITVSYLYLVYLFLGLPYSVVTNLLRPRLMEDRKDPCFTLMLIFRAVFRLMARRRSARARLQAALKNGQTRTALLDLLVKFFFLPIMTTFLFIECGGFFYSFPAMLQTAGDFYLKLGQPGGVPFARPFNLFYSSAYHAIFIMDVGLSIIGYACSSRWLGNKSRSVDPYFTGWLAALICYPPFNGITSNYLPYNQAFGGEPYTVLLAGLAGGAAGTEPALSAIDTALKIMTLFAFSIYVWATMAFGLRFSNLTHRGIISRGPYAYIRHPAFVAKNIAWWTENLRNFSSPWQFVFLAAWNYIYYLRAVTEERHLSMDPRYVEYMSKVKSRFIPGVFSGIPSLIEHNRHTPEPKKSKERNSRFQINSKFQ